MFLLAVPTNRHFFAVTVISARMTVVAGPPACSDVGELLHAYHAKTNFQWDLRVCMNRNIEYAIKYAIGNIVMYASIKFVLQ